MALRNPPPVKGQGSLNGYDYLTTNNKQQEQESTKTHKVFRCKPF